MPLRGLSRFGDGEVNSLRADELDVGARGVEVRVVGDDIALLAGHAEQNAFSGASLVRGNHMLIAEDVLDRIAKTIEAAAARVALVTLHDRRPLPRGHGAGAGVGQQVDEHIVGGKQKQVIVRGPQQLFALFARGPADRFHTLDAKRFDNRLTWHGDSPCVSSMLARLGGTCSDAGHRFLPPALAKSAGRQTGITLIVEACRWNVPPGWPAYSLGGSARAGCMRWRTRQRGPVCGRSSSGSAIGCCGRRTRRSSA